MKKNLFVFSCFAVGIAAIVLLAGPFTFRLAKDILVSRPIYDVAAQFTDLRNWKNWHPVVVHTDSTKLRYSPNTVAVNAYMRVRDGQQFLITAANPAGIVIKETHSGKDHYQTLWAEPDSMGRATRIYWVKYLGAADWIKEKFSMKQTMNAGLQAIKQYMEDPRHFYGFDIGIVPVYDTLILTKEAIIPAEAFSSSVKKLYNELDHYVQQNNLANRTYAYISYKPISNTKLSLAVGIPVNKRTAGIPGSGFLALPAEGRLLVGKYEGAYSGIKALYAAMGRYISDNNLKRAADPLEKYLDKANPSNDSLHIKAEVDFPIY